MNFYATFTTCISGQEEKKSVYSILLPTQNVINGFVVRKFENGVVYNDKSVFKKIILMLKVNVAQSSNNNL